MKRFRWLMTLALAASLVLGSGVQARAHAPQVLPPQTDSCGIPAHWAAPFACDLKLQGVIQGDVHLVNLNMPATREAFTVWLNAATGANVEVTQSGETITRQEAIALLARTIAGDKVNDADLRVLNAYSDASLISSVNQNAMAFMLLHGVVQGKTEGKLHPNDKLTLGEATKLIATAVPEVLPAGTEKLTLVLYNDLHGHLVQDSRKRANNDVGIGVLTTAIAGELLKNPNAILIDGGDSFQGTPISNLSGGEATLDWRNNVGVKVAAVGNHEFDWKLDTLQKLMAGSKAPMITANIFLKGTDNRPEWAKPTTMLTVAGYKVGIIGITTPVTATIVLPSIVENLEFRDPAAVINAEAKKLRAEGAELIVVVTHGAAGQGTREDPFQVNDEVAQWVKGITEKVDVVTAAHSHMKVAGYALNAHGERVPVIQAGSYGQALARVDLYLEKVTREVTRAVPSVWAPSQLLAPTPWAQELLARWQAAVKPIETRPVGRITAPIDRKTTPAGESALGDFIADGMLTAAPGIQIALMNGGGVRADLEGTAGTGEVNFGHMFTIQPFGNTLVTVDMTGAQLKAVLEQAMTSYVKRLENRGGHSPIQVSGITFTWDYAKPDGERVLAETLKLAGGAPVEMSTTYRVVVNNFMAGGGDSLTVLKELQSKQVDLGVVDVDVTVEYFKAITVEKPLTYTLQNRIVVLNFPKQ